ncbi:hypothetical protein BV20DRAFT_445793 [Pilatotrama ljubarskyi]|nr:hypothetical protein BV20DRAFT_445793 [Pilatotrama ljubarskyi]
MRPFLVRSRSDDVQIATGCFIFVTQHPAFAVLEAWIVSAVHSLRPLDEQARPSTQRADTPAVRYRARKKQETSASLITMQRVLQNGRGPHRIAWEAVHFVDKSCQCGNGLYDLNCCWYSVQPRRGSCCSGQPGASGV